MVYTDDAMKDVAALVHSLLILVSQSTFLASGVKKMIKKKEVTAILLDPITEKLLDEMEAGRTRHKKTVSQLQEIALKLEPYTKL